MVRKISSYQALGLPESVQHTLFAIAALLFMSPYLFGMDLGFIKVPDLRGSSVDMRLVGPIALGAALLGYAKLWPGSRPMIQSRSGPLALAEREKLRFGLTLGWQLARLEFVEDSEIAEARAVAPSIRAEIDELLTIDRYPKSIAGMGFRDVMRFVLLHYGTVDIEKHGAILVGVAAMRATLIRSSSDPELAEEMSRIAYSAIMEADDAAIPDKRGFFDHLIRESPKTVPELTKVLIARCR